MRSIHMIQRIQAHIDAKHRQQISTASQQQQGRRCKGPRESNFIVQWGQLKRTLANSLFEFFRARFDTFCHAAGMTGATCETHKHQEASNSNNQLNQA